MGFDRRENQSNSDKPQEVGPKCRAAPPAVSKLQPSLQTSSISHANGSWELAFPSKKTILQLQLFYIHKNNLRFIFRNAELGI